MKSILKAILFKKSEKKIRIRSLTTPEEAVTYDLYVYYAGNLACNGGYTESTAVNGHPSYTNGTYTIWYDNTYEDYFEVYWKLTVLADVDNVEATPLYSLSLEEYAIPESANWDKVGATINGKPTTSLSPIIGVAYYIVSESSYADTDVLGVYKPGDGLNDKPSWTNGVYQIIYRYIADEVPYEWCIAKAGVGVYAFMLDDVSGWIPPSGEDTVTVQTGITQ